MDTDHLHHDILYPVTRVRAKHAGGSGIIIYSKPDPKEPQVYLSFVLTCHHVIENLIAVKEDWDPVLKIQRKKEFFEKAVVEVFDYDRSRVVSANATMADIIAYDKHHDIALLKLDNPRPMPYVAQMLPEPEIAKLRIGDEVWVCGCSLLHDPFPSSGALTYLREIIDQKSFLMANAPSIFGNSGGGLFYRDGHLLGISARVTGIQIGFSADIMTWMEFSVHPERIYEFFNEQELQFLYDSTDDFYSSQSRRKKRQEEALRHLIVSGGSPTSVPKPGPPRHHDEYGEDVDSLS